MTVTTIIITIVDKIKNPSFKTRNKIKLIDHLIYIYLLSDTVYISRLAY